MSIIYLLTCCRETIIVDVRKVVVVVNIFIDADASPVQAETIKIAKTYNLRVFIVKSYAHFSHESTPAHVEVIYVDSEKDAADFAIAGRIKRGDIVITQDYGLASICLAKKCFVIHHKGFSFTEKNINRLLAIRHKSAQARRAGHRTRGPKPFTEEDRQKFINLLQSIIERQLNKE